MMHIPALPIARALLLASAAGCLAAGCRRAMNDAADPPLGQSEQAAPLDSGGASSADAVPAGSAIHPIDGVPEGRAYREAVQALDRGDFETAERIRGELADHPQYSVLADAILATRQAKQGMQAEALQAAERLSTIPVMQPESFMIAGEAFRTQGRWSEAIQCYRNVVEREPQHVRAHRWLGALYHDTGAMQLATGHLRTVAELDRQDYRSLRLAGLIHYEYQNFAEAVADYRRALEREPPPRIEAEIRIELADSLRELRRFEEALAVLEPCAEAPQVLALRAECLETSGAVDEAREAAERAIALEPRQGRARFVLGRICLAERELDAAVEHLRIAVEEEPTNHEPRFLLGRALLQAGRTDEGEAQLARSTELKETFLELAELHLKAVEQPQDVEVRFRLGELAEKSGRPRIAQTWYQAALGLDPGHRGARDALQRLRQP
jgi:tetratricopeptide (TPR) repeat protein